MEEKEKGEMTFLEHLEELRWHIIRSVMAIVVFSIVAFILKDFLFDTVLLGPSKSDFWTNRMLVSWAKSSISNLLLNEKPLAIAEYCRGRAVYCPYQD